MVNTSLIDSFRPSVNNAFMHDTYRRADQRLKERGQRWADLARGLNYSDQRVSQWKSRGISKSSIAPVADFLGVTTDWLLTGKEPKSTAAQQALWEFVRGYRTPELAHLTDSQIAEIEELEHEYIQKQKANWHHEIRDAANADELEFAGHMDAWDSNTDLGPDEVEVPLFREVELAAGSGATQVIENHGAKLRFAKSTLARAGVPMESAACAFVRGNSMEPKMPDGTCIGVNTADTAVRDGKTYAMDHEGMLRVKILHRRPGGGLKVVSMNEEEHPPELYTAEEVQNSIRIIGRVFWYSGLM